MNVNLVTFEKLNDLDQDKFKEEDRKVCEWLLLELFAHRTMKNPITSKQIIAKKSKYHYCKNRSLSINHRHFDSDMCPLCSISYKDHYKLTGVKVRLMVHAMRHIGYPIGSFGNGYYWMHDASDVNVTLDHVDQRINSMNELRDDLIKIRWEIRNKGCPTMDKPVITEEQTIDIFAN